MNPSQTLMLNDMITMIGSYIPRETRIQAVKTQTLALSLPFARQKEVRIRRNRMDQDDACQGDTDPHWGPCSPIPFLASGKRIAQVVRSFLEHFPPFWERSLEQMLTESSA
eukprot:scaffold737_cov127-Skeletonema_marinoi.AAC.6